MGLCNMLDSETSLFSFDASWSLPLGQWIELKLITFSNYIIFNLMGGCTWCLISRQF